MDTEFEFANAYAPIRATDMQGMPAIPQAIRDSANPQVLQELVESNLLPELLAAGADPAQLERILTPAMFNTAADGQRELRGLPTARQEQSDIEALQKASAAQAREQEEAVTAQTEAQMETAKQQFADATGYDPERISSATGVPVQTVMQIYADPTTDDIAVMATDFLDQRPDASKPQFVAYLRQQGVAPAIIEVLAALNGY
jgi:hypothetical protein